RLAQRFNFTAKLEGFVGSLRLELLFAAGVIVAASALSASPPPVPPDARANAAPPSQSANIADLQLTLTVDPDATGANSYVVTALRGNLPVTGLKLWLRFVNTALDQRSPEIALDDAGDGSYSGAGQELDRAGNWLALIDFVLPESSYTPDNHVALRWSV